MTVFFHLDGIAFTVSGVKHADNFDLHSIHVQGNAANIRNLLSGPALERIAEAAAEAAEDNIAFGMPQPVFDVPTPGGARFTPIPEKEAVEKAGRWQS